MVLLKYATSNPALKENHDIVMLFFSASTVAPRIVKKTITIRANMRVSVYLHRNSCRPPLFLISFIIALEVAPTRIVTAAKMKPEIVVADVIIELRRNSNRVKDTAAIPRCLMIQHVKSPRTKGIDTATIGYFFIVPPFLGSD